MPRRLISTLFGHLKATPVVSNPPRRPKAMSMPAEELEAMLLKAIPRYRWTADDVVKDLDLKGKTIIVTGATSGIGIPTATALARTGCSLVITARDPAKGQEALEAIRRDSGNAEVTVRALDLCSFESVKSFVKEWGDQKIDVLLHNAGVMAIPFTKTADKEEQQMQVNFYSVVMLTELLMPCLTETARVCVVSSIAHRRGAELKPSFLEVFQKYMAEDLSEEGYDKWVAYAVAKSAVIMYCNQLNAELSEKGAMICVNSIHPGAIRTGLQSSLSQEEMAAMGWLDKDGNVSPAFKSVEQGASTSTWVSVSPEMEGIGGSYSENCCVTAKDDVGTGDFMSKVKGTAPHVWVEKDCALVTEMGRAHLKKKGFL
mmetsp:Transcript_5009/g.8368  ORF Transcript_5009/g.8368 Transcript_5009/m.8368 type:complete len:372 (-) Transcript_5009:205-1320(-)